MTIFASAAQGMELLRHPEHLHLLLNHLPLVGLGVAWLFLIGAVLLRNPPAVRLALIMLALLALSAWPAAWSGDSAADAVYDLLDADGVNYLKKHRHLADRWLWLYFVTAGLAGGVAVLSWRWPKTLLPGACAVILLAAACFWAEGQIADWGGKIRHPELRPYPAAEPSATVSQGLPIGLVIHIQDSPGN